jgi:hypothetical protein
LIQDKSTRQVPLNFLETHTELFTAAHLLRIIEEDSAKGDDETARAATRELAEEARKTWKLEMWENSSLQDNIAHLNRPETRMHLLLDDIVHRDPTPDENWQGHNYILTIEHGKGDWLQPDMMVLMQTAWPRIKFGIPLLAAHLRIPGNMWGLLGITDGIPVEREGLKEVFGDDLAFAVYGEGRMR